jgi:mannan endo-1,4-beta-mannosidase
MDVTPCDANALPAASTILEYLGALTMDKAEGVISGQNCYHGNQCTSKDSLDGYNRMVTALHEETGKWVAMVGIDYEHDRLFSRQELSEANAVLIAHWKAGGLVTINWAPFNPWVTQDNGGPVTIGRYDAPGGTRDLSKVKLGELVDPKSSVYANWHRMMDRVADALLELQQAGVVVLWRPMQEMSGNWFWWGMKSHPGNPKPYKAVWREMYTYFTETKGLHNLLWVYSPNTGAPSSSGWNNPPDWAYPGDDVVDIIAGTAYSEKLDIPDYKAYLKFNKPIGMGEYAPDGKTAASGDIDGALIAKRLKKEFPAVSYWVSWHSFPSMHWSIISLKNDKELMNDPYVITRDDLKLHD